MAGRNSCYIFFLLWCTSSIYAQLSSTIKAERGTTEQLLSPQASKETSVSCTGPGGKILILLVNEKGLVFQQPGKTAAAKEELIIAPVKKNNSLSIACDTGFAYAGRMYVCWDDEKYSAGNADVFLAYSDDAGASWTEPVLVTYRPNHKAQFLPQMAIDQRGNVNILYFDQQNSADNKHTDIYLAQSKNGGLKFEYYRINVTPFKYSSVRQISLINTEPVLLAWSEKKKDISLARVDDSVLADYTIKNAAGEVQMERTLTFADTIRLDFILNRKSRVNAIITKPLEPGFEKQVCKNKSAGKGKNTLTIDTKKAGLQKGNYTLTLYYNNRNSYAWIIDQ